MIRRFFNNNEYNKICKDCIRRNPRFANKDGILLTTIRERSRTYLFKTLNHTKLDNYEIHHCFGYDDFTKFVYIPSKLHKEIHKYLRLNNIDAKSNHYKFISEIINNYQGYTYVKC